MPRGYVGKVAQLMPEPKKGKPRGRPIKKGQTLNPKGRPVGSKNKMPMSVKSGIADWIFDKYGEAGVSGFLGDLYNTGGPIAVAPFIIKMIPTEANITAAITSIHVEFLDKPVDVTNVIEHDFED